VSEAPQNADRENRPGARPAKREAAGKAQRFIFVAAHGLAGVSGLFALVMFVLVLGTYVQLRRVDPLNDPQLLALREAFKADQADPELKERIRALDLLARKGYFTAQSQIRTGGLLLLGGIIIFVVAIRIVGDLRKELPDPTGCPGLDSVWETRRRGRRWVAGGGLLMLATLFAVALVPRLDLTRPAATEAARNPATSQTPYPIPAPEEVAKWWPCFRGPDGNGVVEGRTTPVSWDAGTGAGIVWKAPVPKHGYSSPVVWSNRLLVTGGDARAREVYCFDTETGALLWTAQEGNVPGAPPAPTEVDEETTGWAAPSAATDGHRVFAIFATGNLLCLDMAGTMQWAKHIGVHDNNYEHASSLILHENLLFVQFDNRSEPQVLALDPADGKIVWEVAGEDVSWSSPICVELGGRRQLIVTDSTWATGYDPKTGVALWSLECLGGELGPSAAVAGERVFVCNDGAAGVCIELAKDAEGAFTPSAKWQWFDALPDTASPVATDAYVFFASSGGLISCVNAQTGETVWEHELDNGCYASPIKSGDAVYALDLDGTMHIFKSSGTYTSLGEPKLGETCSATPALVGSRIYVRGEKNLYCIGTK